MFSESFTAEQPDGQSLSDETKSNGNQSGIYLVKDKVDKLIDYFVVYPDLRKTWEFIVETRSGIDEILRDMQAVINSDDSADKYSGTFDRYKDKVADPGNIREYIINSIGRLKNQIPPRKTA